MVNVGQALNTLDWNFVDVPLSNGIHNIHPYPARFIPQIPRQLIELFPPKDGSKVLDPFSGSGTTLVEATRIGLDVWGIDLHPLACLIARVKTTRVPPSYFDEATNVLNNAQEKIQQKVKIQIPDIPNIDHWFKPDIQTALAVLVEEIDKIEDISVREALKVALSSIIVQVSNQDSNTRYAAVEKDVSSNDVFERFSKAARTIGQYTIALTDTLFTKRGKATVLNADILAVTPNDLPKDIGLVV